jgi:hypothetical protein
MSDEQDKLKVSLEPPRLFGRKKKPAAASDAAPAEPEAVEQTDDVEQTGEVEQTGDETADEPTAPIETVEPTEPVEPAVPDEPVDPAPAAEETPAVETTAPAAKPRARKTTPARKPVPPVAPAVPAAKATPAEKATPAKAAPAPVEEPVAEVPAAPPAAAPRPAAKKAVTAAKKAVAADPATTARPAPVAPVAAATTSIPVEPAPLTDYEAEDAEIAAMDEAPILGPLPAAAVTGGVVGAAAVGLIWLLLRGCEAVRSTASCGGGPGFVLLVATFAICVVLGSALLKMFWVKDPGTTSFLAAGVVAAVTLTFLVNLLDNWPIVIVVPVLSIAAYVGSVKLTEVIDETAR